MSGPEWVIDRILVLSTIHIAGADGALLKRLIGTVPLYGDVVEKGFMLNLAALENMSHAELDSFKTTLTNWGFTGTFADLVLLAYLMDCQWLRLEKDGPVEKSLPAFT
jgi:hypothetical protein